MMFFIKANSFIIFCNFFFFVIFFCHSDKRFINDYLNLIEFHDTCFYIYLISNDLAFFAVILLVSCC